MSQRISPPKSTHTPGMKSRTCFSCLSHSVSDSHTVVKMLEVSIHVGYNFSCQLNHCHHSNYLTGSGGRVIPRREVLTEDVVTGVFENASYDGAQGRYPVINATAIDTTDLAAIAAWHVLQGFLGGLPQLDSSISSKEFNLWTER